MKNERAPLNEDAIDFVVIDTENANKFNNTF